MKLLRIVALSFLTLVISGFLFAGIFPVFYKQLDHEPLAVNYSPDRRFRMEYYAIPFLPFRPHYAIGMGCMDCPGYVRLVDNTNGKILREKYFRMRQNLSPVEWEDGQVYMRFFATWPLPKR